MATLPPGNVAIAQLTRALPHIDSRVDGYNMTRQLLAQTRPDALFAFGPRIAVGAACALRDLGLCIPDDIALVCIDDFGMGSDLDPFMTVARQPEYEMGRRAALMLIERIQGRYSGPPREIVLPAQLRIRRSCGAAQPDPPIDAISLTWDDDDPFMGLLVR